MKIQNINQQQNTEKYKNQSFTGLGNWAVQGLRFLDTNQAWGATAVASRGLVEPRTLTDFTAAG